MKSRWLDTESDLSSEQQSSNYLNSLREDLKNGHFWADRIKKLKNEPDKRLQLALDNLPSPAAFREAAIALRAIIRNKRKANDPHEEELGFLYWLAAIRSFFLEYSTRLREPGFNVIESIPAKRIKSLEFSYLNLGYEKLNLLNKTDCKWLIEKWGEPQTHTTLNELQRNVWIEYENKLLEKRNRDRQQFISEITELKSEQDKIIKQAQNLISQKKIPMKNKSKDNRLLIIIIIVIIIIFILINK